MDSKLYKLPEKQTQVADYILKYIKQNKLKGDAMLPSENQMAQKFGVNRNVARCAFEYLRSKGYIYSVKGKGFFVASRQKPLVYKHSSSIGFSEIVGKKFTGYKNALISCSKENAKLSDCKRFGITKEDKVYRLKTLRSLDNLHFALCISTIPEHLVYNLESKMDNFISVNNIFINKYGYEQPSCDSIIIEAKNATAEQIKYLDIAEGVPILQIECMFSTQQTGPIEHFIIKARSDVFKFNMDFNEMDH